MQHIHIPADTAMSFKEKRGRPCLKSYRFLPVTKCYMWQVSIHSTKQQQGLIENSNSHRRDENPVGVGGSRQVVCRLILRYSVRLKITSQLYVFLFFFGIWRRAGADLPASGKASITNSWLEMHTSLCYTAGLVPWQYIQHQIDVKA